MKPIEPVYSAVSDLIISILVGLALTVPFFLVVPRASLAVKLSFWGIHAIMVNSFLICRASKLKRPGLDPEAANAVAAVVVPHLVLALVFGLVVVAVATVGQLVPYNADYNIKICVFVLSTLAGQSFLYGLVLRHRRSSK